MTDHLDEAEANLDAFATRDAPGVPGNLRDAIRCVIAHLRAAPPEKPAPVETGVEHAALVQLAKNLHNHVYGGMLIEPSQKLLEAVGAVREAGYLARIAEERLAAKEPAAPPAPVQGEAPGDHNSQRATELLEHAGKDHRLSFLVLRDVLDGAWRDGAEAERASQGERVRVLEARVAELEEENRNVQK